MKQLRGLYAQTFLTFRTTLVLPTEPLEPPSLIIFCSSIIINVAIMLATASGRQDSVVSIATRCGIDVRVSNPDNPTDFLFLGKKKKTS